MNVIIFINFSILTITAISFFFILYNGWRFIIRKSLDTFQYKINNLLGCWFITLIYISYFIVFLYCLRLYTHGRTLDLKIYYDLVKKIYFSVDFLLFCYFILIFILLLGIFILMVIDLNKIAIKNILKLFLYYFPKHKLHIEKKICSWFQGIRKFMNIDLFSYYIYEYFNNLFITIGTSKLYFSSKNIKNSDEAEDIYLKMLSNSKNQKWFIKYHPLNLIQQIKFKKYYWFITISPFLLILIECFFNNFVVHYTFYYLLVYTPLMIIRMITNFASYHNLYFCCNLWRIYYYNAPFIYALPARTPTVKLLWELQLMNNLKTLSLSITDQFSPSKNPSFCMDFQDHLLGQMAFFQDTADTEAVEKNLYSNGTITVKMVAGILYEYSEKNDFSESNINFDTGGTFGEIVPPKVISYLGDPWIILHNNIKNNK